MALVSNTKASVEALRYLRQLPTLTVRPSRSEGGDRLRRRFPNAGRLLPAIALAQSVVEIPVTESAFVAGRRKQALRTNVTRSRKMGLSCRLVGSPDEIRKLGINPMPDQVVVVAEDLDGRPYSRASATVDSTWAYLDFFVKKYDQTDRAEPRYLLFLMLMDELRQRGIQYLWSNSNLHVADTVRYFQYLVGFDPANLILRN
jgi:hypothetical protein